MKVYYADIREFGDLRGLSKTAPNRQKQTLQYLKHADRARSLVAGLLLRQFVGDEQSFTQLAHGKPCCPGGPQFNLSHSGNYVVLALSDQEVGIDIEEMRPWSPKVAQRCFVSSELAWLRHQTDTVRPFFILWTAKECIMKASGAGFSMPPESFFVDPDQEWALDSNGSRWYLQWASLPGHQICLASGQPQTPVTMKEVRRLSLDL